MTKHGLMPDALYDIKRLRAERDAARAENESLQEALAAVRAGWNKEAYEGLLLAVLIASTKKVRAGLKHAGSIELGTALDALDMIVADITHFIELNDDATLDATAPDDADDTRD